MHKYESPENGAETETSRIPVAVVGARGYSGLELVRILSRHPLAEVRSVFATDASFRISDYLPDAGAMAIPTLPLAALMNEAKGLKTVFLATPAEASLELAPRLLQAGCSVIDLSGAFRLATSADYPKWYGFEHGETHLLKQARYGLVPWADPVQGAGPHLISNPGCYATSVLMAILPLLKAGLIQPETLVIDAKSGASGAGRKAAENLLFTEVEGECLPYKVGRHQHLPEIIQYTQAYSGQRIEPMFATHLLPVRRGIISSIYVKLKPKAGLSEVQSAFHAAYSMYPLAAYGEIESAGSRGMDPLLSLKRVVGSARTQIRYQVAGNQLYLFSLIDNLIKGAAGQAVENFNRLSDLPAHTSLTQWEGVL